MTESGQVTELANAMVGNQVTTPIFGKRSQAQLKENSPGSSQQNIIPRASLKCNSNSQSSVVTGEPDNKRHRREAGSVNMGTETQNSRAKNNTAIQNMPNKDNNEGLNDKNSQLRGDKNLTRKSLKTKCIKRESDPDNFIEVKVSVVGNAPFNACFLHEKKQLVPLLEQ